MAKIASKKLGWGTVADADRYAIRLLKSGTPFDYGVKPIAEPKQQPANTEQALDLAGIQIAEGTYDIYVTAVDAAGNESDPLESAGAILDFTPPAKPAYIKFI